MWMSLAPEKRRSKLGIGVKYLILIVSTGIAVPQSEQTVFSPAFKYFLVMHDLRYQIIYVMQCVTRMVTGRALQCDEHCNRADIAMEQTLIAMGWTLQQDGHCSRTDIAMGRTLQNVLQQDGHCNGMDIATGWARCCNGTNITMRIATGQTLQRVLQQDRHCNACCNITSLCYNKCCNGRCNARSP